MAAFLSYLLVSLAIVSLCMGLQVIKTDWKKEDGRIMAITFWGSTAWSFGIGVMINLKDTHLAWIWRCVGIYGTYVMLAGVVILLIVWNGFEGRKRLLWSLIPLCFVLVFPFNLMKSAVTFSLTKHGMGYAFKPGIASSLYTYYYMLIAAEAAVLLVLMYIRADSVQRTKFTVRVGLGLLVTVFGMIFDTVMPMLGFPSFPGSTLGQAIAVLLLYNAYLYDRSNSIDIANLSRFVYDRMQEPILIYDKKRRLRIINNSGMRFFNIDEKSKNSYPLSDLFDIPKDWYIIRANGIRYEAKCKLNNTICTLIVDKIEDVYGDEIGYIVVVNDMTEKIHTMREMEKAKEQAEEANEAKSIFLANMSHEIRTPINAVLGMDEMIIRESQAPEITGYAKQIRSASKSLLSIINAILDFSKIDSGKMEIVKNTYDTADFFKDIVRLNAFTAKDKKLKISLEIDESLPQRLYGDEMRIKQIINNIMTNAVKYTDKGGVLLSVGWEALEEVNADTNRKKMLLKFSVKDTGRGLSKEQISKMFDSFQRLDEAAVHSIEGTGLGLSIVKGLLDMMGGSIDVESEPGKGSVFSCTIPQEIASEAPVGEIMNKRTRKRDKEFSKELFTAPDALVLAVDDNRVNLTVLRGLLKRTKVQVEVATGGAEAIEKASNKKYDLIFMDHMMPEIDGIEALNILKSMEENASRDAKIIVLTANAGRDMREKYLEAGFDEYLPKPVDPVKLELMMMKYLPQEIVNKS